MPDEFSMFLIINIILVITLLFVGYKYYETFWSYRISKPHKWEQEIKKNNISKELKSLEASCRDRVRFYSLWFQVERLKKEKIKGAFAELGVYKGITANFLYEMDNSRKLHLFDTFEGFHEKDLQNEGSKDKKYNTKEYSNTSVEAVKNYISGKDNIVFHKGNFPATTTGLEEELYALVHLDADLYQPTIEGLKYFYPRLAPGGVIIVHDYNHSWEGINKAVDEFMPSISENLIELPDWQGSAVIIKNKKIDL